MIASRKPVVMPSVGDQKGCDALYQGESFSPQKAAFRFPFDLTKADRFCILALILLAVATWVPRFHGPLDLRWDGSVYYVLGTSLAKGLGYRLLNEPGQIEATQYPPLLPVLIALHEKILGSSNPFIVTAALKYVWIGLFAMLVVSTYLLVRRFAHWQWALFAGVSTALNFNLHLHFNQCSAELPYAAVTVFFLAIYCTRPSTRRETVMTLAGAAAFFVRTMGVTLLASWVLDGLLRKQFGRAAIRLTVLTGCILLWQGYIRRVESSSAYRTPSYAYQRADYLFYNVSYARNGSYTDPYRPELGRASMLDLANRVIRTALASPRRIGETMTSYEVIWEGQNLTLSRHFRGARIRIAAISVYLVLLGGLALVGLGLLLNRAEWMVPIYLGMTVLAVCASPWPLQHVRYLCPVIPVLLLGLVISLGAILRTGKQNWYGRIPQIVVGGFVVVTILHQAVAYYQAHKYTFVRSFVRTPSGQQIVYRQLYYEPNLIAMDKGIAWLGEHVPKDSVVAGAMPQWIYLQTGLKAVVPPLETDPALASRYLDSVPVSYMMIEGRGFYSSPYAERLVRTYRNNWQLVYSSDNDEVKIYKRAALKFP